jgi:multiple sugar transport system permease protein
MVSVALEPRSSRARFALDRVELVGPLFIAPAILYILLLIALPFFLAIYYSVSAYSIYNPSFRFVGLRNFLDVIENGIFQKALLNTFVFTIGSQVLALVLGKMAALLLLREFPGRRIARALLVLPWAVPVALATMAWRWMFDSLYSVINRTLEALGLIDAAHWPQWLGQEDLAMISVIVVHAWRLFPFAAVIFLAGLTSVPRDVLDAAVVDGAGFWRRNFQIVMPIIAPIVLVALIFGTVFTFTDMSVVYLLTKGGPMNSTHVLGSLGFQVGILSGDVARGAVICLVLLPFLLVAAVALLRFLRRREI